MSIQVSEEESENDSMDSFINYIEFDRERKKDLPGTDCSAKEIVLTDGSIIENGMVDAYTPFGIVVEESDFDDEGRHLGVRERMFIPYAQLKYVKEVLKE